MPRLFHHIHLSHSVILSKMLMFALALLLPLSLIGCAQDSDKVDLIEDTVTSELIIQEIEPAPYVYGSASIVVIPDTQGYTSSQERINVFRSALDWVASNKDSRNIKIVVHVGDMTNNNNDKQWRRIRNAYRILDHKLPYVVSEGNHDVYKDRHSNRYVRLMNDYFRIRQNPLNEEIFGGAYEEGKLENSFYNIDILGQKFSFLALEMAPRDDVLSWADQVIRMNHNRRFFITNHSYLTESSRLLSADNTPSPVETEPSFSSEGRNLGMAVYHKIVAQNPNVEFLVCGHTGSVRLREAGEPLNQFEMGKIADKPQLRDFLEVFSYEADIATGHRSDKVEGHLTFHQLLFNSQWVGDKDPETGRVSNKNGGDGWIMLLEFLPNKKTVRVKAYSPYLNKWRGGYEYDYSLERTEMSL